MNTAILNIEELKKDCLQDGNEYGESLAVLSVLEDAQIDVVLNETQYGELLERAFGLNKDGCVDDEFGIDWDKYDYVTIAKTDENGNPKEFFSFRENWLIKVA